MRRMTPDLFWANVNILGKDDCWPWKKRIARDGYGHARYDDRFQIAHRVAFQLTKGSIPDDLCVMHSCDNRCCCNPNHLSLGTDQDNMLDMVNKGRGVCHPGSANKQAKFSDEQIAEIRQMYPAHTIGFISRMYGVHYNTIYRVLHSMTYHERIR